jgi:uncharacterized FAD-dependent dehydrogenase
MHCATPFAWYCFGVAITVDIFVPLAELPPPAPAAPTRNEHFKAALTTLAIERAAKTAGIGQAEVRKGRLLRRSLDARKGFPVGFRIQVELFRKSDQAPTLMAESQRLPAPPPVRGRHRVVVVGSGPAGTFAALRLTQAGVAVVLIEQGKQVQPRRRDLALLTRGHLTADSNYCFGEGGAGTYSDGKLYTRCKDRHAVHESLLTLVEHGADPDILVESRPHIGSNRLPQILAALREHLLGLGVEYQFGQCVDDFLLTSSGRLRGVRCASGLEVTGDAVVLAVGHSARAIYELCARRGVTLAPKAFAVGTRIEHPQLLIDRLQYAGAAEHQALPAAFYQLATQAGGRGVYSFCMCPGGWVVPSATEPEGLCTNGMSLKRRDSPLANSALVVTVEPRDFAALGQGPDDPLAGIRFQRAIERRAYAAGGGDFVAPAQSLRDFLLGKSGHGAGAGDNLSRSTYRPGIAPYNLAELLPDFVVAALREGVRRFERTMPGFVAKEAQLIGVETRTSSPLRIVRDKSFMSPALPGLYPIGEGAGYAGGIISAAIDGLRAADAILERLYTS